MSFALYTNDMSFINKRKYQEVSQYFINSNLVKEIMKWLKWKENTSLLTVSLAFQV